MNMMLKRQGVALILFLHGAGERGDNLELVKKHGPPKLAHKARPAFYHYFPQCEERTLGQHQSIALLDHVLDSYKCDRSRVYLTGLSMGGFGTFSLGLAHPDKFAAIAPICGGGEWIRVYGAKSKTGSLQDACSLGLSRT